MKKRFLIPIGLIVVGAAAFGIHRSRLPSGNRTDRIAVSGNIEITEAQVAFKIPGKVEQRLVEEGQHVQRGQLVARLDSEDLEQDLAIREADLQVAVAALEELKAGSRPEEIQAAKAFAQEAEASLKALENGSRPQEIRSAKERVAAAEADADRLGADAKRGAELYASQTISAQEYDKMRLASASATAKVRELRDQLNMIQEGPRKEDIDRARARLEQASAELALIEKGPREEKIRQAEAVVQQARAARALASIRLSYASVTAPLSGIVLSKNLEAGEYVSPGTPVVTLGNLEDAWLRAYINETDLGRVKVGQRAEVFTDSYPGKSYAGRITFISSNAEFTPKTIQTSQERVKLVYRIKIAIENKGMELKPGMPADAVIHLMALGANNE